MSFIPDPERPLGPAIDTDTGALAHAVLFVPQGAGLDQAVHIGWTTDFRRTDGEDLRFEIPLASDSQSVSWTFSDLEYISDPDPGADDDPAIEAEARRQFEQCRPHRLHPEHDWDDLTYAERSSFRYSAWKQLRGPR